MGCEPETFDLQMLGLVKTIVAKRRALGHAYRSGAEERIAARTYELCRAAGVLGMAIDAKLSLEVIDALELAVTEEEDKA